MPSTEPNAGLKVGKTRLPPEIPHPAGSVQHGGLSQTERAFSAAGTFFSGVMAISASQFIGQPLKLVDPEFYKMYMMWTKQSFAVLITTMTEWWSPTVVRVSGDESMKGQLIQNPDGTLKCDFPDRLLLMANHQLYTDWLYLWWVAYTNNMHGSIYIILKESLRNIPIIGWGCQFYNFIFLSRKWETDRTRFHKHLQKLNKRWEPMWLLIFPEGTNLAKGTREKSAAWAKKTGVSDMKHQLLPRTTGIRFCLQQLRETTDWLYDCTIAYEGIPPGMFGQDIFTLRSSMFEGRPPKSVNMYWRRFKIADIPVDNEKAFDIWLRNRWTEKDHLLEHFSRHNRFPVDKPWERKTLPNNAAPSLASSVTAVGHKAEEPRNAKYIETQVKSKGLEEFLSMFAPVSALALANPDGFAKILESVPGNDIPISADMKKMIMDAAGYLGGQQMELKRTDEEIEKEVEQLASKIAKRQGPPPAGVKARPGLKKRSSSSSSSSFQLKDLKLTSATGKPITLANGVVIHPLKSSSPPPQLQQKMESKPIKLANGMTIKVPGSKDAPAGQPITLANGMRINPSNLKTSSPKPVSKPGPKPAPKVAPTKSVPKPTPQKLAPPKPPQPTPKKLPPRPPASVSSTIANERAMSSVSIPSTATISTTAMRAPPSVASNGVPRKLNVAGRPLAGGPAKK